MKKVFNFEYQSFLKRSLLHSLDWGLLFFLVVTFVTYLSIHFIAGLLFTLITILYVANRFWESRYYITSVIVGDMFVQLEYLKFDKGPTSLDIPVQEITTQCFESAVGNPVGAMLVIKKGAKTKLKQFVHGHWTFQKMKTVHEYFQDLKKVK